MMAANPRLKALPKPHEQVFIDAVRKIREKRLTTREELPDLPKALSEKALALFTAMTDFGETGFWQAYDALAEDTPQLRVWKDVIVWRRESMIRVDPTWETVTRLFPGQTGMKILLAILASAVIVQRSLPECGQVDVAVLHCQSMATFALQLGCGKDTLLRYVTMYQALGLLTRTRVRRGTGAETQLHLPLTPYQPSAAALERVKALTLGGRKKQQDLARVVSEQYVLLYRLPVSLHRETSACEDPVLRLLTRTSHILQKPRIRRVERQLLQQEITEMLGDLQQRDQGDLFVQWRDREVNQGDLATQVLSGTEDLPSKKGDLQAKTMQQLGDLSARTCDEMPEGGDPSHNAGDLRVETLLQSGDLTPERGDFSPQNRAEMPDVGDFSPQTGDEAPNVGDLKVVGSAPSSIDSFYSKDSLKRDVELESQTNEPWTGSEHDLSKEATQYLKLLDGPEYATPDYLNTHAGKKALGGYRNQIRRNPQLARIAAINTLLHRTFYDLTKQKKPLENAGKWFHSSFNRYADPERPMEIMGEIMDWAKSPYTLEEIALVFSRERRRQEIQWNPPEAPHLPFSSCVVTYQYLRDTASTRQIPISKHHDASIPLEAPRRDPEESLEFSASPWMSRGEAEQLADEMSQEASWYLDRISVRPEPPLGDNVSIVEAFIVDSDFAVAYATRQDWWHDHQAQLRHRRWEEQQKGKKRRTQRVSEANPSMAAV
jgi:hypothetical protein